jgi:hypothetical protein
MEAIITLADGRRMQVIVAALGRFTMRVIARGRGDAMELKSEYGQWLDEAGKPVEFEALLAGEIRECGLPAAHSASFDVM